MLNNKNILLGITGGIAAYKAVDLASKLTKMGAEVKTVMTAHACEFISPVTFKSITHQPVITKMFDAESDIEHIS
ncbi:MAG: bifunctional 4'-phosphopantothenoylcysteine decarboxylase/phosphopantothenoylcysteine synthetase, partial [Candidatus Cloacimonetes bacterium]|nr:bifunctional 4'-phosphopantothenoylcysteine decarboxylase/phosphopantothenoylcysteine synthetase [Candidatus Cloacimonadota bacterium]